MRVGVASIKRKMARTRRNKLAKKESFKRGNHGSVQVLVGCDAMAHHSKVDRVS
jgi:hypothetical protein